MTCDPKPGYLASVPPLPDELLAKLDGRRQPLTEAEEQEISAVIADRKPRLRSAREAWEQAHGSVSIEPPYGCDSALAVSFPVGG